jgi:ribosomal protein S18 acetylase RimI-like enzyme
VPTYSHPVVDSAAQAQTRPGAPQVRRAAVADAAVLGATFAEAFADDPVFGWLIPHEVGDRDQRLRAFFTSMSRSYLRRGKPAFSVGDDVGAALWSAPGSWSLPFGEIVRETPSALRAFGRNLPRALRTQLQVESLHPRTPHWYLGYLGTRAAHQGKGVGSAVLREVLEPASAAGVPAYLESSNERNLSLYERNGFRVVGEIKALGRGPTIWRMWREP